jgi:hypothetical protein
MAKATPKILQFSKVPETFIHVKRNINKGDITAFEEFLAMWLKGLETCHVNTLVVASHSPGQE